jgi:hypothetical protein
MAYNGLTTGLRWLFLASLLVATGLVLISYRRLAEVVVRREIALEVRELALEARELALEARELALDVREEGRGRSQQNQSMGRPLLALLRRHRPK